MYIKNRMCMIEKSINVKSSRHPAVLLDPLEYHLQVIPPTVTFIAPGTFSCSVKIGGKIDLMPCDALENQSRDVDDEVDAEVQRDVPELLSNVVVGIGTFVESLVHHLWLFGGGRRSMVMMVVVVEVVVGNLVVDYFLGLNVGRKVVEVTGKVQRFRRMIKVEAGRFAVVFAERRWRVVAWAGGVCIIWKLNFMI